MGTGTIQITVGYYYQLSGCSTDLQHYSDFRCGKKSKHSSTLATVEDCGRTE